MSKKAQREIPADMWLHVASDAMARWSASGAGCVVRQTDDGIEIALSHVRFDDPRLAPAFIALFTAPAAVNDGINNAD